MRRLEGAAVPEEGRTEKRGRHILIPIDVGHMDYLRYFNSRVPFMYLCDECNLRVTIC